MIFGPSGSTAVKTGLFLLWTELHELRSTSTNHCHPQMLVITLSCKNEAMCENLLETFSLGQISSKINGGKVENCSVSDESNFEIYFWSHEHHVLHTKEERNHPTCFSTQFKSLLLLCHEMLLPLGNLTSKYLTHHEINTPPRKDPGLLSASLPHQTWLLSVRIVSMLLLKQRGCFTTGNRNLPQLLCDVCSCHKIQDYLN